MPDCEAVWCIRDGFRELSFREHAGMPAHRVIANLGRISDPVQLENLKAAFDANRTGQRLARVGR